MEILTVSFIGVLYCFHTVPLVYIFAVSYNVCIYFIKWYIFSNLYKHIARDAFCRISSCGCSYFCCWTNMAAVISLAHAPRTSPCFHESSRDANGDSPVTAATTPEPSRISIFCVLKHFLISQDCLGIRCYLNRPDQPICLRNVQLPLGWMPINECFHSDPILCSCSKKPSL